MQAGGDGEFRRGWTIVLAGMIGAMVGISALPFYTLGVFVKPVGEAFGWDRATVQLGFTAQAMTVAAVNWAFGLAADRWGSRRVAILSQLGFALGLAGVGLTSGLVHWYVAWMFVSLLGAGTSPVTWTRGVSTWFDRSRGAALGLTLMGTGITAVVAPPIVTAIVEAWGWRAGYFALAAAVLLIGVPTTALLFRDQKAVGHEARRLTAGLGVREAILSYRFIIIVVAFVLISFGVGGTISNLVPLLTDRGLPAADAALYASLVGFSIIVGRVTAGFLVDRFWAPAVAAVYFALPALASLALAQPGMTAPLATALAVAVVGLAAGAEFDLVAFFTSRYFGMRHYGLLYAIQMTTLLLAAGFAPPIFGRVFDLTGSYGPVMLVGAAMFAIAPLLLLTLGRYPDFGRRSEATHEPPADPILAA